MRAERKRVSLPNLRNNHTAGWHDIYPGGEEEIRPFFFENTM